MPIATDTQQKNNFRKEEVYLRVMVWESLRDNKHQHILFVPGFKQVETRLPKFSNEKFIFQSLANFPVCWQLGGWTYLLYACLVASVCDPMDCSLPGSSVHGFSRQEYWSGLPFPSPSGFSRPRDPTQVSYVFCIGSRVLYH